MVNAARDAGRRSAREAVRADAWAAHALVSGGAVAEAGPEAEDPAEALWAAVRDLPAKQREAVTLVYGEDMNHAEAADLMGCSEATVSWHIHEAKKRLRKMMAAGEV